MTQHYDAIIVGASIAGSCAAIGLARRGARVALLERRGDPDAYKTICGHFLQSSSRPALERLGVLSALHRAGAVDSTIDIHTPWGWIRSTEDQVPALNLRRSVLDPLLRRTAAETPGVDLMLGETVDRVRLDEGRGTGVECVDRAGRRRRLRAALVVAADGRGSRVAELANVPARTIDNARFAYYAYFSGIATRPGGARAWYLDPDVAFEFPTDNGLTMLACMPERDWLPEFKRDLGTAFSRFFAGLPDAPATRTATRETPIFGKLEMQTISRPAAARGIAFVGDAALAADPLPGVGCGWAVQSAEWLADCVGEALLEGRGLERSLRRYRRRHRAALHGHEQLITSYSSGRAFNPLERLLFSAAVHDAKTAAHLEAFGSRRIRVRQFLAPRPVARAARVRLRAAARTPGDHVLQPTG
ncbi:NAD(P)/FAD-dependent oxidoreductase [Paraconexibacter sp.]|uniref:NAD(P)/FAD-dependent oxidoreductase n=1 Tax=Paraconexibacter sp. TaxID=2949640 RepID=UPI003567F955